MTKNGKIGLAALGGGLNGGFSAGALDYIWEEKITPNIIEPISVNVLNVVSVVSQDSVKPLIDLWLDIGRRGPTVVFRYIEILWRIFFKQNSLFTAKTIDWLIEQHLDIKKFYNSPILIEIVTRNESHNCELNFFPNRLDHQPTEQDRRHLKKIIKASVALRGIFPPVRINDEWHSDGLIFNLDRMVRQGCRTIIILSNEHDQQVRNPQLETALVRGVKGLTSLLDELVLERLSFAQAMYPDVNFIFVKPDIYLPRLTTVYSRRGRDDIRRLVDHGRDMARRVIEHEI